MKTTIDKLIIEIRDKYPRITYDNNTEYMNLCAMQYMLTVNNIDELLNAFGFWTILATI